MKTTNVGVLALVAGGMCSAAWAQSPCNNGNYEVADLLNPSAPSGWKTDNPGPCYWGDAANGDLARNGTRSVVVGETGSGAVGTFHSWNTDRFDFFANGGLGAFFDYRLRWNGGTVRMHYYYAIRANEALPVEVPASFSVSIKGAGDPNQDNIKFDGFAPANCVYQITGHTGGQWRRMAYTWTQASYQAAILANATPDPNCVGVPGVSCPPYFQVPTIRFGQCVWPNRIKVVLGRFNPASGVAGSGKIFMDDFWIGQGGDVAGSGQIEGLDGQLTADDIIVFINWFFASDPRADIAGSGQTAGSDGQYTADDIIVFINEFFASDALPNCPA